MTNEDRDLLFSIMTKLGHRVKREDINLTESLRLIQSNAVPHVALHFAGYMRDYFRIKYQEATGLNHEELQKILSEDIPSKELGKEYSHDSHGFRTNEQ